jgi:hypothetical protein
VTVSEAHKFEIQSRALSWTTALLLAITAFTLTSLVGRLENLEQLAQEHDRQIVRMEVRLANQ